MPVVGQKEILSGLAGALLVFLFSVGYTEFREARQRVRERAGLARLLIQEIEFNENRLGLTEAEETARTRASAPPRVEVWIETRLRFAQLVAKYEEFEALADYYVPLQSMMIAANRPLDPESYSTKDDLIVTGTVRRRWIS